MEGFSAALNVCRWLCDPHSPWQRGSNMLLLQFNNRVALSSYIRPL